MPGHQPGKSCFMSPLSLLTLSPARGTFVTAPQSPQQKCLLCLPWNWEKSTAVEEGNERRWWGKEVAKEMDKKNEMDVWSQPTGWVLWRKGRDRAFVHAREALRKLAGRHGKFYWKGLQGWKMSKGSYERETKQYSSWKMESGRHRPYGELHICFFRWPLLNYAVYQYLQHSPAYATTLTCDVIKWL